MTETAEPTAVAGSTPAPDNSADFGSNFGDLLDKAFAGTDISGEPEKSSPEPAAETPATPEQKTAEPEKPADKPEATKEEAVDEEAPKNMSPKAAEKWAALKAKTKAAEDRIAELEKKISESDAKGETNSKAEKELTELQQKLQTYEAKFKEQENELAVTRIEATEEYKQVVVAPMQQLVSQIEGIAKKYEVPLDNILRAIVAGPDSNALEEVASSFSNRDQTRIFNLQDQYADIQKRRESIRTNAEEALKIVEQRRQAQQQQALEEQTKVWNSALDQGWEQLKTATPLFAKMEDHPDFKKTAENIQNFVRGGEIDKLSVSQKAMLLYQGAAAPVLEAIARDFYEKNQELEQKLKSLQAASPAPSEGSSSIPDSDDEEDLDFGALIERKLRS